MKRLPNWILLSILFMAILSMVFPAFGEHESWDCPKCGRTGNKGNYCGSCGHPAPWIEFDAQEEDEYEAYKAAIDKIEAVAVENPWSLEEIMNAFVKKYGSEKAVNNLKSHTFHRFDIENVTLSYYYADWYYTYSVRYYDDKHKNLLFEHEYIRVVDQSSCDTSKPTYSNWFASNVELVSLTAASGKKYHLYCANSHYVSDSNGHNIYLSGSNQYVEEEYYDSITVSQYNVLDGWDLFIKKND